MSNFVKKIRKVVTHVPTGKQWVSVAKPHTPQAEENYVEWQMKILQGFITCFTMDTAMNESHCRLTLITEEVLKQCVVDVEIYEDRDE